MGQGLGDPFGLALDGSGNLYIADFGADKVFEVPAGTTTVEALGLQDLTKPLGEPADVYAYKPGQYTSYAKLTTDVDLPTGLLVAKP